MSLDIFRIAAKLNDLAAPHPIGALQDLRARLKGLIHRPGHRIFSAQTTFERWAFHHGGRKELQFNIGYWDRAKSDDLRHGVAFSFQRNRTLRSIDVLVPKAKLFDDFLTLNADEFRDMGMMWYYKGERSMDQTPAPICSSLAREELFVFLGNRQPAHRVDYEKILNDFDRLLALYEYVESGGLSAPAAHAKPGFDFKPGFAKKAKAAKATVAEKVLDLELRHDELQKALYRRLALQFGEDNVRMEQPSGVGTRIDLVVKRRDGYWFYEIKSALTPRTCLREAIGQLLEYAFWPGAQEPTRFIVVGENPIDGEGQEYLGRLRKRFSLPIEYEAFAL
jgi:hypothetical protein